MIFNLDPGKLVCQNKDSQELWAIDYGKPREGALERNTLTGMVLSKDGKILVYTTRLVLLHNYEKDGYKFVNNLTTGEICTVHVVDVIAGQEIGQFSRKIFRSYIIGNAERLTISPDGSVIGLTAGDKTNTIFLDRQGKILGSEPSPSHWETLLVSFSPNGEKAVLWPIQGQKGAKGHRVSFLPTHPLIVRSIRDGHRKIYHGKESVCDVKWTLDGKYLIVSRWDGSLTRMTPEGQVQWQKDIVLGAKLEVFSDGRILAGTASGRLMMFDSEGKLLWKMKLP